MYRDSWRNKALAERSHCVTEQTKGTTCLLALKVIQDRKEWEKKRFGNQLKDVYLNRFASALQWFWMCARSCRVRHIQSFMEERHYGRMAVWRHRCRRTQYSYSSGSNKRRCAHWGPIDLSIFVEPWWSSSEGLYSEQDKMSE